MHKSKWLGRVLSYYRLVRTDDPESFYMKMGPFGLKPINNGPSLGPPVAEFELQIRRLGTFCEVPLKKHYERIFFEGHGPTHSGSDITESTI